MSQVNPCARLGILGGMGPEATALLYRCIVAQTQATCDQEHLPTLIWSDPTIPDRTAAIVTGESAAAVAALTAGAKLLAQAGCTLLVMPCNTAHYFLPQVQEAVEVPFLDMPALAAREAARRGWKKAGILATRGTVSSGLYQKRCAPLGVEVVAPQAALQEDITHLIYNEMKQGHPGTAGRLEAVGETLLQQGCDGLILACTELSVYRTNHDLPGGRYIDALDELAKNAILTCGFPLRTERKGGDS